ncbi:hypothetical protein PBY51_018310 [Eleginops maclovinus]|uniref:Uncharacterized protein n=1 Tax=Eleginops maclovinus TaxID=56733 RepID=A0AAN8AY07_ELEMC|nr:hypothetical protein PBY51_018310 [Eleginops maclovinus]
MSLQGGPVAPPPHDVSTRNMFTGGGSGVILRGAPERTVSWSCSLLMFLLCVFQKQRGAEDPHCRIRSSEDLTITSKQELAPPPPQAPQKPIRRKYHPEVQNLEPPPTKPAQRLPSKQKRQIQMLIRKNKETNAVLTRLNSDLQQQLKEVHQDRLTLESQLELRRPLAPT